MHLHKSPESMGTESSSAWVSGGDGRPRGMRKVLGVMALYIWAVNKKKNEKKAAQWPPRQNGGERPCAALHHQLGRGVEREILQEYFPRHKACDAWGTAGVPRVLFPSLQPPLLCPAGSRCCMPTAT